MYRANTFAEGALFHDGFLQEQKRRRAFPVGDAVSMITSQRVVSLRFLLVALFLIGGSGCADPALDANRSRAREVLRRVASDTFADASTRDLALVRHKPSGLECVAPATGGFSLEVFPPTAAHPGVYCARSEGEVVSSFVAVYYGATVDIDTAFSQALAASAGQASPQPWTGEPSTADKASPDGLPHFRISRFQANVNGAPSYLRIAMAEAKGWFLQQVVSGPIADAEQVEGDAGVDWRRALAAFAKNVPDTPS